MIGRFTRFLLAPRSLLAVLGILALSGCGKTTPVRPDEYNDSQYKGANTGYLFGDNGLVFGTSKSAGSGDTGGALGVNAYLWRGALDTLSFMPLSSADPFGGVIITDWFQPPTSPGERFKATAYILGRQLRADGVRVALFRQVQQNNQWVDAPVSPATVGEIENKVLARARELRAQTGPNSG